MEFFYFAYGLLIRSVFPMPELSSAEGRPEVVVRLGNVNPPLQGSVKEGENFLMTREGVYLFWEHIGKIFVREGRDIIVDPAPEVDGGTIRLFILGPALGITAHQRGGFVLHGSAVTIHGRTVAFLGGEETGKSTLAAAIYAQGHSVVVDDVVVVRLDAGCPVVNPGFPYLKLRPKVANALGDLGQTQQISYPCVKIRAYPVKKGFSARPIPLRRIYLLHNSKGQKIEPLKPQEAFIELIKYSYCPRLLSDGRASLHLLQCATLVNHIPIFRLNRPRSISSLPDVVRMVEKDLAHE